MNGDLDQVTETIADHVVADAVTVRTRPSRPSDLEPDTPDGQCSNCATVLQGPVCHICGQVDDRYHRPFYALIAEALDGILSFDGRAWKTLPPMLYRPGYVTQKYLSGSRASFIPPFRLYIIASLIFFLLIGFVLRDLDFDPITINAGEFNARAQLEEAFEEGTISEEEYNSALEEIDRVDSSLQALLGGEGHEADTGQIPTEGEPDAPASQQDEDSASEAVPDLVLPDEAQGHAGEDDMSSERRQQLAGLLNNISQNPSAWGEASLAWVPRIMFVMVPVYAILLALTYIWRRGLFFYDHLVVSIHFHAALFLAMSVVTLLGYVIGPGWALLLLVIYSNVYLYRLMRRIYGSGRISSVLRILLLDLVYLILLMIAFISVIILGALSL